MNRPPFLCFSGVSLACILMGSVALAETRDNHELPNSADSKRTVQKLSLDQALQLLRENNPDLNSARINEAIARIQATRIRLNRYSTLVSIDGGYSGNLTKVPGYDSVFNQGLNYEAGVSASLPLYTGGRIGAQIEQADLDLELSEIAVQTTERTLIRALYLAYWNIKSFELQLIASLEALELNEDALEFTVVRSNAGLAAPIDVNRSRVNVLNQKDQIQQLQGQRFQSVQDLLALLNIDTDDVELLDEPDRSTRLWPEDATELVNQALMNRPELDSFEKQVARAEVGVVLSRSSLFPTLSLSAVAGMSGTSAWGSYYAYDTSGGIATDSATGDTLFSEIERDFSGLKPTLGATVGLDFSWTPFTLFQTRDAVRVAEQSVQQVEVQNVSQRLSIEADVRAAHNGYKVLNARTPIIEERLQLARDNLEIIQSLYSQGSTNLLDLFNTQAAYQAAVVQMASHQVNLVVAEYELRWTLGESMAGK